MIDLSKESLVPLSDVPALLPRNSHGNRIHISAIFRWASKGLRGIVLEVVQVGGRRMTSREALNRFFSQLSATYGLAVDSAANVRPPATREREHNAAEAKLDRAGVTRKNTRHKNSNPDNENRATPEPLAPSTNLPIHE